MRTLSRPALASLLAAITLLPCCSTVSPMDPERPFEAVAGQWVFSHTGPPSIATAESTGVAEFATKQLQNGSIHIKPDGNVTFIFTGKSGTVAMVMKSVSPSHATFGSPEESGKDLIYDRKTKLITMSADLDLGGTKGSMPIYFKKQ
jgi:hypothetical protein